MHGAMRDDAGVVCRSVLSLCWVYSAGVGVHSVHSQLRCSAVVVQARPVVL